MEVHSKNHFTSISYKQNSFIYFDWFKIAIMPPLFCESTIFGPIPHPNYMWKDPLTFTV